MRNYALHKEASSVFDAWQLNQDVFNDAIIHNKKGNKQKLLTYYECLKEKYKKYPGALHQLEVLFPEHLNQNDPYTLKNYAQLALTDTQKFIAELKKNQFSNKNIYKEERLWPINKIIKKYTTFLQLLFADMPRSEQNRLLYLVANKFFTFCFDPNNTQMDAMISQQHLEPLVRMMYSIMWKHLGSRGWQSWHQKTIDNLMHAANSAQEVVYIAGGSDIHQLLKHAVYNIRIIDPFLPTQDTYYSNGWKFLVKGAIGDTIECCYDGNNVVLQRSYYHEQGTRTAQLSNGKKRRVPRATIIWDVYNNKRQKCGSLTIERRFAKQSDFSYDKNKKILFSFNELYFITTVHEDAWGIDVEQFDSRYKMYVKQLNDQLSKDVLLRMRDIDEKFAFIQLGNCIN